MAGAKRILLVEDEEDICWALRRILGQMGYDTATARTGGEALALAQTSVFHMGLVDAKLPDIEGTALAARMRESRDRFPLVLISGYFYEDDDRVRTCIADGLFTGFVSKPFLLSEIRKAVDSALHPQEYGVLAMTMEAVPRRGPDR